MSTPQKKHSLAILDDYHNIAAPYFAHIANLDITSYPETLHPTQSPADHDALINRLHQHDIISTMRERTPLPSSILTELPNLRLLLTTGTRNLAIDTRATVDQGIAYAGTTPPIPSDPIARAAKARFSTTNEHTWALLLALAKNVAADDHNVKTNSHGGWATSFATGLAGKKIGLLGLGRLGAQAAITASLGFGMTVLAHSTNLTQARADEVAAAAGLDAGAIRVVSKQELFATSDVVSVHLVLSERSRGAVGRAELDSMKPEALFVNTSRGPLVDEEALLTVLKRGAIRGAALDVFDTEPLPDDSEWRSTEWGQGERASVVLSPHMGYAEVETMRDWYRQQAENVQHWIQGEELVSRIVLQEKEGAKM